MAGWAELHELIDAAPQSRRDLQGRRLFVWPAMVLLALVCVATATVRFGEVTVVAVTLPVLLLAAWSCGPRWALWFAIVAAVAPGFLAEWHPVGTSTAMVSRFVVYIVAGMLVAILRTSLDRATEIAECDRLTGLLNRTGFAKRLSAESNRARRAGWPIAVGFLDCDNFKKVNDENGHLAGDEVLKLTAATIAENVRNYDSAARFGGDEFVILWPVLSAKGGEDAARRLHGILTNTMQKAGWQVGFSLGVAVFETIPTVDEMLAYTDKLMYEAKRGGKGTFRVSVYREPLAKSGEATG